MSRANAPESRLLRLPCEMQEQIWGLAIGGRNIHIAVPDSCLHGYYSDFGTIQAEIKAISNSLYRTICTIRSGNPYSEMYPSSNPSSPLLCTEYWGSPFSTLCGGSCPTTIAVCLRMDDFSIEKQLGLLLVCRQIYGIASRRQFTENTFCFSDLRSLFTHHMAFARLHDKCSAVQWNLLRSIDFNTAAVSPIGNPNDPMQLWVYTKWAGLICNKSRDRSCLAGMPGLQVLSLRIRQSFTAETGDQIAERGDDVVKKSMMPLVELFKGLRHAQLKELYILVWRWSNKQGQPTEPRFETFNFARGDNENLEKKLRACIIGLDD